MDRDPAGRVDQPDHVPADLDGDAKTRADSRACIQEESAAAMMKVCARVAVLASLAAVVLVARVGAQAPLDEAARAIRAHEGLLALDRYLETWNSRDPARWATSLNFPHMRPGPGPVGAAQFVLSRTPAEYIANVNFEQTAETGWDHTEWVSREVLQVGLDKVHVAGTWQRYTIDGRPLTTSAVTYVVTNQDGH